MDVRLITLYLPEPWIQALDRLVNEKRLYANRATAIRMAVRDLLIEEAWQLPKIEREHFLTNCPRQNSEKI